MKDFKESNRPVLPWILLFNAVLLLSIIFLMVGGYVILKKQITAVPDPATTLISLQLILDWTESLKPKVLFFGIPGMMFFFLFWSLLMWRVLLRTVKRRPRPSRSDVAKPDMPAEKIVYKVDKDKEDRLYAHLLSVFQREGRLVDFLFEQLDGYEDDQIGAAVRNIHGNCRKVMDRHVKLKPILDYNEGDEMTVKEGFDPALIRLVGNVKGEPPFNGIVRHPGWQITKLNIPDLAVDENAGVIEPAEIEIL